MATTGERSTQRRAGDTFAYALAAAATINKGAVVMIDAGLASKGAASATAKVVGIAKASVAQAEGDAHVEADRGTFLLNNSVGADELTAADLEAACYLVDDETVAKTDGGATRCVAGIVREVAPDGVWVTI